MNMDFDYKGLANEVINRGISIAENFEDWTKLCFALSTLGEDGREIFKALASTSDKYRERENDMKFNNALRTNHGVNISSFIWMCKAAGIDVKKFAIKDDSRKQMTFTPMPKRQQPDEPLHINIGHIPYQYVVRSLSYKSNFVDYLCGLFATQTIKDVADDYALGATKDRSVIYWQIDVSGKVRQGKVMKYDADSGHRIKEGDGVGSVADKLKKRGVLPSDYNLVQCLFGEHLLKTYPDKTVAIVEAEKTALICAALMPSFVWLASGGKGGLQDYKLPVLAGRNVVLFPDTDDKGDCFKRWSAKAEAMRPICKSVYCSDLLEKNATAEEKAKGIDVADYLIRQLEIHPIEEVVTVLSAEEKKLLRWEEDNPAIKLLVDKLDLEIVKS